MQRRVIKFLIILAISFFGSCELSISQVSGYRLQQADSLFKAKRYVQSLEQYQSILAQDQFTAVMLLKMAFIHEGLGHIGPALYCLNLYYSKTQDPSVITKMEELALKYNLTGYDYDDRNTIFSLYHEYYKSISFWLCVLAIFMLSVVFFLKRNKRSVMLTTSALILVLIGFLIHINVGQTFSSGIVSHSSTYLMAGPSSGANVIAIIDEGHRFDVIGKKDVWLKIKWYGETAFVKENNLLTFSF